METFPNRSAIVRGYVESPVALHLYGLGAISFTIPSDEQAGGRVFTVAVFIEGKHDRDTVVAFDADANATKGVVSASGPQRPLELKANVGYALVLYGDQLAPTPLPSSTYPPAGNNPFPSTTPLIGAPPTGTPYGMTPAPPGFAPTPFHT
ncbi:MAG: hypothetical protein ACREQ5_19895 [Candidatus Dormibacteria bacterium]